ncbi:AbfB domain-containing protein [Saccharothrix sp. ALI-22-I]|uniref:AbfB domain-containing protein n=1 Tax=Saccharothrix sp. ALI-22-I TaxID=1933778 RepID=UPI001EE76271|nr:AbfB domain-containing protein [Saccharothrix sp. ALI-22-I]
MSGLRASWVAGPIPRSTACDNFPGNYLRHQGFEVKLAPNDGTSGFAADATFTRVAGLADASWSSFRSVNYPTRYLRHSNFVLRIDEITTTTARADATFHLGY